MALNKRMLRMELDKQSNVVFNQIKPKIQKKFEVSKNELLDDFDDNKITQEIQDGPKAKSRFISTAAGGNLFSFLGFSAGMNPTDDLRKILQDSITLQIQYTRKKTTSKGITWETPIMIPTLEDINEKVSRKTPLEWSPSKAWTTLIEKGIPWFAHYLFDDRRKLRNSESGTAIQIEGTIKEDRKPFTPQKYISKLLSDFKKSLFN